MIIIGNRYEIPEFDKQQMNKIFKSVTHLKMIHFFESDLEHNNADMEFFLINEIKKNLSFYNNQIVVLNFNDTVTYKIINFLISDDIKTLRIFTLAQFFEHYLHKCFIPDSTGFEKIDYITNFHRFSPTQLAVKHLISSVFLAGLIGVSLPLIPISALIIKKESEGPVFFTQPRIGRFGKIFTCFKFRSMKLNDAEKNKYTAIDDHRITRYGNFMRKFRIDELPQIFNILKREMSLVGPRTEWSLLVEEYERKIPYYKLRHLINPGITGWAQVNYPYGANDEDTRQKLMYDLYYIKYWSPWLELKTYFKTVAIVLGRKGI